MTAVSKLASSLNRRDELPNKVFAKQIVAKNDKAAVKELVENLITKNKGIASDCIKVIYEVGLLKPKLIARYVNELISLLDAKSNRLQWGAMMALNTIANEDPKSIYAALAKIIAAADEGSVITNDHCAGILIKLCANKKYADDAFALLNERLLISPENQFPVPFC